MNIQTIREDFPILANTVYDRPLVYLDNAATTQKPRQVVDRITNGYYNVNANIHRGVHYLSIEATEAHERARVSVQKFVNAGKPEEIVFTRGTTEAINLVASSFSWGCMSRLDEILVSSMEHHSNIVPWQLYGQRAGYKVKEIPISPEGEIDIQAYGDMLGPHTRMVAIAHVSNVLGTVNPLRQIIDLAHANGTPVLVDGAQAVPHIAVDVQELDVDFYAFSSHKVYGPTGMGVLYGKENWLDRLPPYQGGGEMISTVSFEKTSYNVLPYKFEAGTPDYIGSTALAEALKYVNAVGIDCIAAHEHELLSYATERLKSLGNVRIFGESESKCGVISFLLDGIHPSDTGTLLDRLGIAVRTGHHCAQPLMKALGIEGTVRASFALYNTKEEVDALIAGLERVSSMFKTK